MNKNQPSILVAGAGAIGGITAALLKKASHDVEIVVRTEEYARTITETGIEITGFRGKHLVRIPAYPSASSISNKKDIILLATKAADMALVAHSLKNVTKEDGFFISMQNGMCENDLASVVGKEKVIGCVTGWGATMESHGKLIMTSGGEFIIGYPGRVADDRLYDIAEILSSVVPTRVTDNITGHKYSKLMINSCITTLGAVSGLYLGEMLSHRKIRNIFTEIIREAIKVADRKGIKAEIFAGRLDFKEFIRKEGLMADLRRHLMIRATGFKYRKLKSSSLQSLERKQPTEIDFLNGYIVKNGNELGVDVPVNSALVNIIHEIESGKRKISPDNFRDPVFDRFA